MPFTWALVEAPTAPTLMQTPHLSFSQQRHHLLRHLIVFDVSCNSIAPKVPHVSEMQVQVEHEGDDVRGGDRENRRALDPARVHLFVRLCQGQVELIFRSHVRCADLNRLLANMCEALHIKT
jgi:hypothetical protein